MGKKMDLSKIDVASPCPANWEQMSGDEKTRFCGQCKLHVHNISAMTELEAVRFFEQKEPDNEVCIRFFRRSDGTLLTQDCPVGLRAIKQLWRGLLKRSAAVFALLISSILPVGAQFGQQAGDLSVIEGEVPKERKGRLLLNQEGASPNPDTFTDKVNASVPITPVPEKQIHKELGMTVGRLSVKKAPATAKAGKYFTDDSCIPTLPSPPLQNQPSASASLQISAPPNPPAASTLNGTDLPDNLLPEIDLPGVYGGSWSISSTRILMNKGPRFREEFLVFPESIDKQILDRVSGEPGRAKLTGSSLGQAWFISETKQGRTNILEFRSTVGITSIRERVELLFFDSAREFEGERIIRAEQGEPESDCYVIYKVKGRRL